jgi:hypothetical protein
MRIQVQRNGLRYADRVRKLDRAGLGVTGGDDVFRDVTRGIGRRAVDFGRVFAGERAAAMRSRAAVSVDDDLASCQTRVADRTADDESVPSG